MRTGVLWFLLALAAVTAGRWWTAALWALVAFPAGVQTVLAWDRHLRPRTAEQAMGPGPAALARGVVAGLAAAAITLAAGWSTGLAGVALTALSVTAGVAQLLGRSFARGAAPVALGMVLGGVAGAGVVLVVRSELWVGILLVLAVSLYDAGAFVFGAEAKGRWEGPVLGTIGVAAVTFTMSTIGVQPFERHEVWITGAAIALGCVLGQLLVGACLPHPAARAAALRRLDGYVVSGPAVLACIWLLGN